MKRTEDKLPPAGTEEKIIRAAEEVFYLEGYGGARMRIIADKAGINKGLLHYYFKTKEKLFDTIFGVAINKVLFRIQEILEEESPLFEKIDRIVDEYSRFLAVNPAMPRFVLNELGKNPDHFLTKGLAANAHTTMARFRETLEVESRAGLIRKVDAHQLLLDIFSLVIFPYVGQPMVQLVFGMDNRHFKNLVGERKEHVKDFIKRAIAPGDLSQ